MAQLQLPPTKRARLDDALSEASMTSTSLNDNMEDLYDTQPSILENSNTYVAVASAAPESTTVVSPVAKPYFTIPGLAASTDNRTNSVNKQAILKSVTNNISGSMKPSDAVAADTAAEGLDEMIIDRQSEKSRSELDTSVSDYIITPKNLTNMIATVEASTCPVPEAESISATTKSKLQNQLSVVEELEPRTLSTFHDLTDETLKKASNQLRTLSTDLNCKSLLMQHPPASEADIAIDQVSSEGERQPMARNECEDAFNNVLIKSEGIIVLPTISQGSDAPNTSKITASGREVTPDYSLVTYSKAQNIKNEEIVNHTDAEVEIDSSPFQSSCSDLTSSSSSSDDSDDEYELLDPEEQARRLMQEDGGSDEESRYKGVNGLISGPLRTLNEKPEEIVEKPNVNVTPDMKVEELGNVESLVENVVLIKAKISGEYKVLETGSTLCLENRDIVGVVAETLGRVQQPYYSVRFTNAAAITESGIMKGTRIFYIEQYSVYVFTEPLKAFKGSDASNMHDEEVGDDELEFSDDEAEADYKHSKKVQKQAKRGGRATMNNDILRHSRQADCYGRMLNYGTKKVHDSERAITHEDKAHDDELYTPLTRPTNLFEMMDGHEAPMEAHRPQADQNRRGKGSHGRPARGNSDRSSRRRGVDRNHREGHNRRISQGGESNGFQPNSLSAISTNGLPQSGPVSTFIGMRSPQPTTGYPPGFSQGHNQAPQVYYSQGYSRQPSAAVPITPSYSPHPYSQQQLVAQNLPGPSYQWHTPLQTSSSPGIPPGAYVNPAFFGNQYYQPPEIQSFPPPSPYESSTPVYSHSYGQSQQPMSPGSDAAFKAAQDRLNVLQQLSSGTNPQ